MLRLAVILPETYRGGTLRGAINIARMLAVGARTAGDSVHLSFGHVDAPNTYGVGDFDALIQEGIHVRPFKLQRADTEQLRPYLQHDGVPVGRREYQRYSIFNDGVSNFEECDFWIVVSDRLTDPIPPNRHYATVVYDYIQRYVPEIFPTDAIWRHFESFARVSRSADFVMCTTEQTRGDCINYAGVHRDRVLKFPMEFDPTLQSHADTNMDDTPPYLLWTTNSTQHKNHINVLKGLDLYFSQNPDSTLTVTMTGVYTHLFLEKHSNDPHFNDPYIREVRKTIAVSPNISRRLKILGNIPDKEYVRILAGAFAVLHGAIYDNGTYAMVEAAWWGVPTITSDYPAVREACETFGINPTFFDAVSPAALAGSIGALSREIDARRFALPSRTALSEHSFLSVAPRYWAQFKDALALAGVLC